MRKQWMHYLKRGELMEAIIDMYLGEQRIKIAKGYLNKCREIANYHSSTRKFGMLVAVAFTQFWWGA